jgi:hypothetical protein
MERTLVKVYWIARLPIPGDRDLHFLPCFCETYIMVNYLRKILLHNLISVPSVSVSNRTLTMEIRSVRRGSSKDHHLSVKLSPAHQLIQDSSGSCQGRII